MVFISVADAVLVILVRLAQRPFTFSNGTTVPAGTLVGAPISAVHTDGEIYGNPDEFDGFRFAKLREREDGMGSKHQTGTTSATHLSFGYGRHAWWDTPLRLYSLSYLIHICIRNSPGRSFATVEMKALLAKIVTTYDFKLEEGKKVPSQVCVATSCIVRNTDVLFRKRQS